MRLIDADALVAQMEADAKQMDEMIAKMFTYAAINDVNRAPTVDAVQVIRCKDCKWYDMTDPSGTVEPICYRCKRVNRLWREPDDFCKGAEKMEVEE